MDYIQSHAVLITLVFSAVVTVSTLVYAVLTAMLVAETRRMRKVQTEPKIEISIKPREDYIKFVFLRVRNIGLGGAYNLKFEISSSGNEQGAKALRADFFSANFFKSGLQYLGPGHELLSGYTDMGQDYLVKIEAVLRCHVTYEDGLRRKYRDTYTIAFSEYNGMSQGRIDYLGNISQSLEKIEGHIRGIASGTNKLSANIYDRADREQDQRTLEEVRKRRVEAQGTRRCS